MQPVGGDDTAWMRTIEVKRFTDDVVLVSETTFALRPIDWPNEAFAPPPIDPGFTLRIWLLTPRRAAG